MSTPNPDYVLGNTDAEHERLIRQAARIAALTERFVREAGLGPGQRVLDLGSGVGDVALLAGKLVGPSGEVVGVERDTRTIARARARAAEAGHHHVSFIQSDVAQISSNKPFDAVVGRFILQFLPDPVGVLRSVSQLLRPGGAVAFQEPSWVPFLLLCPHLPPPQAVSNYPGECLRWFERPMLARILLQRGVRALVLIKNMGQVRQEKSDMEWACRGGGVELPWRFPVIDVGPNSSG